MELFARRNNGPHTVPGVALRSTFTSQLLSTTSPLTCVSVVRSTVSLTRFENRTANRARTAGRADPGTGVYGVGSINCDWHAHGR